MRNNHDNKCLYSKHLHPSEHRTNPCVESLAFLKYTQFCHLSHKPPVYSSHFLVCFILQIHVYGHHTILL